MPHGALEVACRIHAPVRQAPLGRHVHVGDLGDDHRALPLTRLTSGHATSITESSSTTALTGRVTKIVTSLPCDTMLVRKYCSAIGPRMIPMTRGGMGRS